MLIEEGPFCFLLEIIVLCNFFLHVAALLLEDLIGYEEIQQPILMGLVGMLKASDDGLSTTATAGVNLGQWLLGVYFHCTFTDVITCYHSNSTQSQ